MANYSTGTLGVNYGTKIFINISSNPLDSNVDPVWAELGDGITNITENLNENVISSYYLINHGFGNTEVTAMNPSFELTGVRMHGDPAQDWIFDRKFKMLNSRKTQMKVQVFNPDNADIMYDTYKADITISNLQEISGATEAGSDISMTVNFNGSPTPIVQNPRFVVTGDGTATPKFTLVCPISDAAIYYTSDGSDPSTSSTLYTAEVSVSATATYKAIAVKEGYENSEIVSKTITVGA